jgi:hypothetical protein
MHSLLVYHPFLGDAISPRSGRQKLEVIPPLLEMS